MTDPRKHEPSAAPAGAAEGDPDSDTAEFEAGEVEAELADARRRAEEYLNDLRRVAADFDNYRKRVARESEANAARATESLVGELLPVLDNLERALDASEHHEEALSHQPSDQPEGTVAAVWQRGYRLGDRVVRAARVVVSSGPPATEDD